MLENCKMDYRAALYTQGGCVFVCMFGSNVARKKRQREKERRRSASAKTKREREEDEERMG